MNERKVRVVFFKENGKYYTSGEAVVKHHIFEDEYKQDIVDTQNKLMDGWQEHEYYVVVTEHPDYAGKMVYQFDEQLFMVGAFKGLKKKVSE